MKNLIFALVFVLLAAPAWAEEQPLDQPNMDTPALLAWTAAAAAKTMTFSHLDYQKKLQQASKSYTEQGWKNFTSLLKKSYILDTVQAQQQYVTAEPRAPVLMQHGILDGRYRWLVSMELLVKYTQDKMSRTDLLHLQLTIERVGTAKSPEGVAISDWALAPIKPQAQ